MRTEVEQFTDPSSTPASAANAVVPHLLCCLNMLRQSRGKKRQLHARVIKTSGRKKKEKRKNIHFGWQQVSNDEVVEKEEIKQSI